MTWSSCIACFTVEKYTATNCSKQPGEWSLLFEWVLTATNASYKMSLIWTNKWICKKYHPHGKHIHVPKTVPVMPPFCMEGCSSCCGRSELEKKLTQDGSPQLQCMDLYYTPPLPPFRNASLCTHSSNKVWILEYRSGFDQ